MYLEKEAIDYFRRYDIQLPVVSRKYGDSPSRILGRNMEFEKYNTYHPGDNIKDVDWKVYARTNKLFIKNYGSDLSSQVRIILDNSASMSYQSKLETAKRIIAAFFYVLNLQHNQVSLATVNTSQQNLGTLTMNNLEKILFNITANGKTDLAKCRTFAHETIFLISDLWVDKLDLTMIKRKRIHIMHILTRQELELNISGNPELIDSETGTRLSIIPSDIRHAYQQAMFKRLEHIRNQLWGTSILYGLFPTDVHYVVNLKNYLERLKAVRFREAR